MTQSAARGGEQGLILWYIFLSGWRINDSAKTLTPLRETPPVAGRPGQLSLQNEVSIIISRVGQKAMTYTDLLEAVLFTTLIFQLFL